MQAELKVVGGKQNNQVVPLPQGKFLIGREQDCHLRPNSELVSRHHCVVTCDEFGIRIRDLGSTNGTFVNEERIEKPVKLKAGDKVVVGSLNFELVILEAAVVPVAAGGEAAPQAPVAAAAAAVPTDMEAEAAGTETIMNMPAIPASIEDTQNMSSGDTTMLPAQPQPQQPPQQQPQAPGYPPQQPQFNPPPMQYPPGYGQFQPQPQMYPPQYPGMPYPQPMPGYPMPPQQMPMPMPQQPPAAAPVPAPDAAGDIPEVSLPKPGETGLKEEQDAKGSGGSGSVEDSPSSSAGDIIKQYIQRRPE